MSKWQNKFLSDLVLDLQPGFACRPIQKGVPQIRPLNFTENGTFTLAGTKTVSCSPRQFERYKLKCGDILFNNTNSPKLVGKSTIFKEEGLFVFSNHITRIRVDKKKVNHSFLSYYFLNLWRRGFFQGMCTQWVNQAAIKVDTLKTITIPTPPIIDQERIVKLLDEADELQNLRARVDSRTAKLIPALFNEMFGKSNYPQQTIGELTKLVTSGATPRGGDAVYVDHGPYFIRSQNVRMNHLDLSDVACIPVDVYTQMARTKVCAGDVLLNITGASIGRVTWVDGLDREANVSQHVCIIRPIPELLDSRYLSVLVSLPSMQNYILNIQSGASRQALNHKQVRGLKIPIPPLKVQQEFTRRVSEIRALEAEQAASRARLDALFQSLLHRAFNGEL